MSKIKILSDQLTNKIAAGEVVQNPASMVKELVENSIDAGSTEIIVVIQNGGKSLCEVIDNGEGMTEDDLLLAFERYATSKIKTVEDLINIRSLGFRGEALASIAAVSQVTAITTHKDEDVGHELVIHGGSFREIKPHSPKPGTTISIKNLFYNIPARRKFLKSKEVEFRKIVDVMRKFVLLRPDIRFTLVHGDREVFSLVPQTLPERIDKIFSNQYSPNLLEVRAERGDLKLTGYIGNLNLVRVRTGEQFFYVNHRFVTDRYLNYAVLDGFSGMISRGEYPFFCLSLELPPDEVDVNVHPTKMEVKFSNQYAVTQMIKEAVKDAIKDIMNVIPNLDKFSPETYYAPPPMPNRQPVQQPVMPRPQNTQSGLFQFHDIPASKEENDKKVHFTQQADQSQWQERAQRFTSDVTVDKEQEFAPNIKVFQIHNKYIISQIKSGLVIIDQHVAHERILYEEAMESFTKQAWKAQQLLFPQVLELSVTDMSMLLEVLPFMEKLGFKIKEFGKNAVAVEAVPAGMRWGNEETIIKEILDHYQDFGSKDTSIQSKVAASYACKAAIKSGDKLTEEEMRYLIDRLFTTSDPYFCPHGRPVIVNLTLKELDKRFERI